MIFTYQNTSVIIQLKFIDQQGNRKGDKMNLEQYKKMTAETLEKRIAWWRDARFGMFIHYGIYYCYGRGEWIIMREGISREGIHPNHAGYELMRQVLQPKLDKFFGME